MPVPVLTRFKVEDFERWRAVFESKGELRKSAGSIGTHIFRNAKDPTEVIVNMQWQDESQAAAFYGSEELKAAMREAGVIGSIETTYLEDAGRTAN
jgi:heme-degrading monooxygenase HmoA